jgi:NB-ARC domain
MDADRAIAIIETLLAPKSLTAIQRTIVRGVIAGDSYQQIVVTAETNKSADPTKKTVGRYQIGYVKETGAQLWQSLSQLLGQKVTKKSLAAVLYWYAKQSGFTLESDSPALLSQKIEAKVIDWGEGIQAPGTQLETEQRFYGRTKELATLKSWCLHYRCRTIALIGMGGIGKSTLAWELAHQLAAHFEQTIWRSLLNAPSATELCADLLRFLSPHHSGELPDTLEGQIALLIDFLNRNRCLLIFDNVESILAGQVQAGKYLSEYEDYDLLFKSIGELSHQSCLLLTSREQPHTITRSRIANPQLVRSLNVGGLTSESGHQLIQSYGCAALPDRMWQEVHQHYGGNPLALKIAAITAVETTGGGEKVFVLYPLMRQGKLPFQGINDVLQRQFERLSAVEQQVVYWLAIEREPITLAQLRANLLPDPHIHGEILNALQSLLRRCIVIRQEQSWTLQPVTIAYVTQRAIDTIVAELSPANASPQQLQQKFTQLNTYAIIRATAKDYLRHAQIQSTLRPILDRLLAIWLSQVALAQHLQQVLSRWQSLTPSPPGYLAGNILNLLIELSPDRALKELDCSGLPIWSAYLVDVELLRVNFAGAAFERSVFTHAGDGAISSTFHPTGELVATGDANGNIYL